MTFKFFNSGPIKAQAKELRVPLKDLKLFNKTRISGDYICRAPFNSLRFERYGKVMACCHNNSFLAGHYPQNSIKEIWEGAPLKSFRKDMSNSKLNIGCRLCYDNILSGKYFSVSARMFDNYSIKNAYPTMLDFKTDNTCNLECIMCFSFSSCLKEGSVFDKNIAFEPYNDNFIEELTPFIPHLEVMRFSGGEPFMSGFYLKLWKRVIKINPECIITVQTNGHILNDSIKKIMDKGRFSINVSLDSLNPETYAKIRVNGNLDKVLENINYFNGYCNQKDTKFKITTCPMRSNVHELPALINFCNSINANIWFSIVWYPLVYALWTMQEDKLRELYNTLTQVHLTENSEVERYNKKIYLDLLSQIQYWGSLSEERQKAPALDLKKYIRGIYEAIESYYKTNMDYSINTRQLKAEALKEKVNTIIEKTRDYVIPQNSFDILFKHNHQNMFVELFETEPTENILKNIGILYNKSTLKVDNSTSDQ